MSVTKNARRGGSYEVRRREGGRRLSRSFNHKADAEASELDIKRRNQLWRARAGRDPVKADAR